MFITNLNENYSLETSVRCVCFVVFFCLTSNIYGFLLTEHFKSLSTLERFRVDKGLCIFPFRSYAGKKTNLLKSACRITSLGSFV